MPIAFSGPLDYACDTMSANAPKSIDALSKEELKSLRYVLTDIDGTLTDDGRLGPHAYTALWDLHEAGLHVIPVTGRPAGWCDLIVRQWPVSAVIGENGAFALWLEDGQLRRLFHPNAGAPEKAQERLGTVREAILAKVPGSRVATDQPYRLYDLAIDFCEDPPDLGLEAAEDIRKVFEDHGAHAKVSNIHVNGWFGDYDKVSMSEIFLKARFGLDIQRVEDNGQCAFAGDSPNDAPMFGVFQNAIAVANIAPFLQDLEHPPKFITQAEGGQGFAAFAQRVLAAL